MAKFFFISAKEGVNPELFSTFIPVFEKNGHEITEDINNAECVFIDAYSGAGTYDKELLDKVIERDLPVCLFDESDYGGMSKERFFAPKTEEFKAHELFVLEYIGQGLSPVYFMRKMDKTKVFPLKVFPFEKCLYKDCDFPLTAKEELFNRPYDICWIGNTSPQRENVVNGLLKAGLKKGRSHTMNG
jgi:hypothetical protein